MIINYSDQHIELEEEGRCNLVLIAARYTGDQSTITANRFRRDAAWPGYAPFQSLDSGEEPGPAQGALIPDWTDEETENRTVEHMEAHADMEVFYRPEDIAREMLYTNYLDPNVFGMGFDPEVRDRVFDALGLEDVGVRNETEYRQQLREIAGVEPDEEQLRADARDDSRVGDYRREHTRAELIDAASILGYGDDPETDHDSADAAGKIALSTWLAEQDAQAVRFALEGKVEAARDTQAGTDVDAAEAEPFTPAAAVEAYDFDELKAVVKAVREGTGEFSLQAATATGMAEFLVDDKGLTEAEIDGHLTG